MFLRWMVFGAFGGCLFFAVACSRPDSGNASVEPVEQEPGATKKLAPEIEGEMLDGSPFSLKEKYATNVVMLDFWATGAGRASWNCRYSSSSRTSTIAPVWHCMPSMW